MNRPLYDKLVEYSKLNTSFHMPGHKFGAVAGLDEMNMAALDNTEAKGMDNLYEAEGIIKEAMELMAEFYSSKSTIFLTNGSTSGILASILATCRPGDKLIVARNSHHSVWSALILAGIIPVYISPEYLAEEDILGEMSTKTVEGALKAYPEAKGVLIVSPTYEGVVSDVEAIAKVVHEHDAVLIVDEAHGAHFVLGEAFPESSIKKGADIVINSMHKTLPTLTQSALLHICSNRVRYEGIIQALRMVQTSSPSYVMMGIMDYIRSYIIENRQTIETQYIQPLKRLRLHLNEKLKRLELIEPNESIYDIGKVIVSTLKANISGYELEKILNESFNISIEAALENYIILMTTMADNEESLSKLEHALCLIDSELVVEKKRASINSFITENISIAESPRDIFYFDKEWISIEKSEDRILSKNIMLYPPGIPIVAVGERVTPERLKFIRQFNNKLQGIKHINDEIFVEVVKSC